MSNRGDALRSQQAFDRFLELLDLTVADPKTTLLQKREVLRARENSCESLLTDTPDQTVIDGLKKYFFYFALAARCTR